MVTVLDKAVICTATAASVSFKNQTQSNSGTPYSDLVCQRNNNAERTLGLTQSGYVSSKGPAAFNFSTKNKNKATTNYYHHFIKKTL